MCVHLQCSSQSGMCVHVDAQPPDPPSHRCACVCVCVCVLCALGCCTHRGGHGRTGTVIAIMLGLMYNLSPTDAMWFTQLCHDMRACPMGVPSPQTEEQRHQVVRLLSSVRARRKRQQEVRVRARYGSRC